MNFVRALERYADRTRPAIAKRRDDEPRCEVCGARIGERQQSVVDRDASALLLACATCAATFRDPRASGGRYRAVPARVIACGAARIDDAAWRALGIGGSLAFFVHDSKAERWRCVTPDVAGPSEFAIGAGDWYALADAEPLALAPIDDVEALLVRRDDAESFECFVAPLDECYAIVSAAGGGANVDELLEPLRARSAS
jgi:hypothetical protein